MADYEQESIHIENLRVECIIGLRSHERKSPQHLLISISFPADFSTATETDDLMATVDYTKVAFEIREFAKSGRFRLLETLARKLAAHLGERFGLERVMLRIQKTNAIADSDGPAVSLTWSRKKQGGG